VEFDSWDTGSPILRGCIANLDCNVESMFEGGDHVIIVGQVGRMIHADGDGAQPLVFYRGRYAGLVER
jgi:flavin reductase (DIM6/NTAB) family NADH-FMN oxidoreductase RutF